MTRPRRAAASIGARVLAELGRGGERPRRGAVDEIRRTGLDEPVGIVDEYATFV